MGMMYAATFDAQGTTAARDLFEITAPADAVVRIHSVYIGQTTDMGDAAAEALTVTFNRGATSSGSGGATPTPAPLDFGYAAAGSVVDSFNNTQASGGTIVAVHKDVWNIQLPYQYRPTPEERITLSPSQRLTVAIPAPADSITISGTIIFEEIGG